VLLGELGLTRPATSSATIDTTAIKADLAKALLQDVQALSKQLREEQAVTNDGLHKEIGSMLDRVEQIEQQLQISDTSLSKGLNGFQAQIAQVVEQLQQIQSARQVLPSPPSAPNGSVGGTESSPVPWLDRSVRIFSAVLSVGQILGVAGVSFGSFGIAGLAVWGLRWLLQSKPQTIPPTSPAAEPAAQETTAKPSKAEYQLANRVRELSDENAGLREQLTQATQKVAHAQSPLYAPYETEIFREAYEWSAKETARKFPGAVDTLELLGNFIDQYLSSKGLKGKA
jgi:hypothetical protein